MLQYTHLETPTPTYRSAQNKVPLSVFSKGIINLTIFRRSIPNCGASKGIVRDQKSSPVPIQETRETFQTVHQKHHNLTNITHCYDCPKKIQLAGFFQKEYSKIFKICRRSMTNCTVKDPIIQNCKRPARVLPKQKHSKLVPQKLIIR